MASVNVAVRMYLHRMVVALGSDVLTVMPIAIRGLLSEPTVEDLTEFVPLLAHMVVKFKAAVLPVLQQTLFPLVEVCVYACQL